MNITTLFLSLLLMAPLARAADFDFSLSYAQSRDFWNTVQDIQDRTGNLSEIQKVVKDKYGKPDILYSYLDASYSYPHEWYESDLLSRMVIGTKAEALAGGEISNPVFPEIQAYANSVGILSFGLTSEPRLDLHSFLETRLLLGLGPEKRIYAQGAELIDAIPVRSGTLLLGGGEIQFIDRSSVGEDFWITTSLLLRGTYFHSTVKDPKSRKEEHSYATWRWRLQNEWLKETETFLSNNTRFGLISVLGQNPFPYLLMPVTWDYQQKLRLYPGLSSISGIGGIIHFLTESSLPNVTFFTGYFGGAIGGGLNLQLGSVLLQANSYGVESLLTPAREKTRIWNLSLGVAL